MIGSSAFTAQKRLIGYAAASDQFESSSASVKDLAQMLPEVEPGAPPREATCAARRL